MEIVDLARFYYDNEMWEELYELQEQILEFDKYNKLYSFIPYPYQKDFMNKCGEFHQRMMRSGNQVG